jgi:Helix-turn-helix domain
MDNFSTQETFTVQGFTPYAQIPKWILRSGSKLSHGAVRLYGTIMTYADNDTKSAFPGREKLSVDMGSNLRSVSRFIKELEDFGALKVTRRRNQRTGNFYANHYILVFNDPSAENGTRRDAEYDPITTPTILSRPTSFTSNESDQIKDSCTPEQSSGQRSPGNLSSGQRKQLRQALQAVGALLTAGHKFYDDEPQGAWANFYSLMEDHFPDTYDEQFADLLENDKWTVSAAVTNPYKAGAELNKIINTAARI